MTKTVQLTLMALGAASCGLVRVPFQVLEQLPYEAKIELLEAENELAVAVDRLDEVRSEINRTELHIRRAKEKRSAAQSEIGAAPDANSKEVAHLALTEADKRVDMLRARQSLRDREATLEEHNLKCAEARYERARLAAARKAKLKGSETLDPARFEAQVSDCEAEAAKLKEKLAATASEADAIRTQWEQARTALAKKTFDARASPYVE